MRIIAFFSAVRGFLAKTLEILGAYRDRLPISDATWQCLTKANFSDWARYGVFATAFDREDFSQRCRLLYVGKSPGPKGDKLGLNHDQRDSGQKTWEWMIDRKNSSPFWWFIDDIVKREREHIAWTNVCKMDQKNGKEPNSKQWREIEAPCFVALKEEITFLKPKVTLFVTKNQPCCCQRAFDDLLVDLGYNQTHEVAIELVACWRKSTEQFAFITPHPGRVIHTGPMNKGSA